MTELELRKWACDQTLAEFMDKPFDWKGSTCIHLLHYHAERMGHDIPKVPAFKTAIGAKRALTKMGNKDLPALLDSMLERVPPAMMRVGDVMALPGDAGFHSIVVRGATSKFIGWHEDAPGVTIIDADMNAAVGAWRL